LIGGGNDVINASGRATVLGENVNVPDTLFITDSSYVTFEEVGAGTDTLHIVNTSGAVKIGENSLIVSENGNVHTDDTVFANQLLNKKVIITISGATGDIDQTNLSGAIYHVTRTATGSCTITLDSDVALTGYYVTIKDAGGNASTNNILIQTEGAETIDGQATFTITGDDNAIDLYSDGTNWFIY